MTTDDPTCEDNCRNELCKTRGCFYKTGHSGSVFSRSGSKEEPAREAERYAHGSDVIAELRARAMEKISDASKSANCAAKDNSMIKYCASMATVEAFRDLIHWLNELSGSDQKQGEGTKPNA